VLTICVDRNGINQSIENNIPQQLEATVVDRKTSSSILL